MIKIKRTAAILLAVGLTLSSVTGCSMGEGDSSETGVTIYTDATDEDETTRETESETDDVTEKDTQSTEEDTDKETDEESDLGTDEETESESIETEPVSSESEAPETPSDEDPSTTPVVPDTTPAPETPPEKVTEPPRTDVGLTAVAQVRNYVNVRTGPSTDYDVVGKVYNNCAATILAEEEMEDGKWYYMASGNVMGYIKAEFFVVGEEAEALRETIGKTYGKIIKDYTRVRETPTLENLDNVVTMYRLGTLVAVLEIEGEFAKIETDAFSTGYVHTSCLEIWKEFDVAISLEEEAAREAERLRLEEEARLAREAYEKALYESSVAESLSIEASIAESVRKQQEYEAWLASSAAESLRQQQEYEAYIKASIAQSEAAELARLASIEAERQAAAAAAAAAVDPNAELRNAIVAYALQFVGCPYVLGGQSLTNGTDCSNFIKLIYRDFGIAALSGSPTGQIKQGTEIPWQNARPGDILFYSNSTHYLGHVALYIGNGKIVHAANPTFGICVWDWNYRIPIACRTFIP